MKSRFEPDIDSEVQPPAPTRLIDPDEYDASEQQFAASVDEKPEPPRFVLDPAPEASRTSESGPRSSPADEKSLDDPPQLQSADPETHSASLQSELLPTPESGSWRGEVAARVNNYRARRRPREPRYPSLQLRFDPPQPLWTSPGPANPATSSGQLAVAMQETFAEPQEAFAAPTSVHDAPGRLHTPDCGAKILEFPRSFAPVPTLDELAEPVMDRPRILEVPDLLPPLPALGGITIEPVEQAAAERRPGFELPLQAAPMARRLLAGFVDSLLVISAVAAFAYIFFRVTSTIPPLPQAVGISAALAGVFWCSYQYLLFVYAGTTPGLMLARLQLNRFDGNAVPRKIRRWRVLASMLSGLSLALGYAWCFLDEDRLCWHDRITRTYMAPKPAKNT